jgi:hypothetical protein
LQEVKSLIKATIGLLLVPLFLVSVQPQTRADKRQTIVQTENFLESILTQIQDPGSRALIGVKAGSIIWSHDQQFAQKLFQRGLELTAPGQSNETEFMRYRLAKIRVEVVKIISKHDRELVVDQPTDVPASSEVDLDEGFQLIKNSSPAAGQYIADQLARGVNEKRMLLLRQLRRKDPQIADAIFLAALNQLSQAAMVDEPHISLLGTYVLTSPLIFDREDTQATLSIPGPTGEVRVTDLRACRPGMDPVLVAAFSQAFVRLMERLPSDPAQQEMYYLTGKMLQKRIASHAPEFYGSFVSTMSGLEKTMEARRTAKYESYSGKDCLSMNSTDTSEEFNSEQKLDEIKKKPGQVERDWERVELFLPLWDAGRLDPAVKIVEEIEDLTVREQVRNLLKFVQARQLLKKREAAAARKIVVQLPQESLAAALLWLGLAQAQANDKVAATEDINLSFKAMRKLEPGQKANLLLNAAGQMAPLDAVVAVKLLGEACLAFEQEDPSLTAATTWNVEIKVGTQTRKFFLKPELSLGWEANLPSLVKADSVSVAEAIRALKRSQLKGLATLAFVAESLRVQ